MMSEKDTPLTEAFFYILLALRRPNHGYGVIQEVEQLTDGRVVLGPGTLYGALQTMQKRQWIRIYSQDTESRKKKEYVITELGRQAFETEKSRLEELLNNAKLMEEGETLTGFFVGFYRFEACEKGEYTYQVDLGDQLFFGQQ